MPSLKNFKHMMEDCINDTLEKKFVAYSRQNNFNVDEVKELYNSTIELSRKFGLFYNRTIAKQNENEPIDALSFVAQLRADSYKDFTQPDQFQYTVMTKLYEALPIDQTTETKNIVHNVKLHAEYQALEDPRIKESVSMLGYMKSNNLRAELDLQLAFADVMGLCASYSDDPTVRSREKAEADNMREAAKMLERYMPHLNEQTQKPLDMKEFISDQKAALSNENKLNIPAMKQVCSFIPIMRIIDDFERNTKQLEAISIRPLKMALLAVNGRDVKSVVSGLVTSKISIFKSIERLGASEDETKRMKERASYIFRWVLRDVEGAFKIGYALVAPTNKKYRTPELSMA